MRKRIPSISALKKTQFSIWEYEETYFYFYMLMKVNSHLKKKDKTREERETYMVLAY